MIKFKKAITPTGKYFISECGEYKIVNYGGQVFMYYKLHGLKTPQGKTYSAFGNSVEHDSNGKVTTYKTYREAMNRLNQESLLLPIF